MPSTKQKDMVNRKMKSIGKYEADIIHREIDAALKVIADKYGLLSIKSGNLKYDRDGMYFHVPIKGLVNTLGENGLTTLNADMSSTAAILRSLDLEINALAYINGSVYRVTGYNSRKRKHPISLINVATSQVANGSAHTIRTGILAYKAKFPAQVNQG